MDTWIQYQDMKWEYHSDSVLPFFVVIAGKEIPISISDIKFMGTVRTGSTK